jgi:hypothetical protein
MSADVTAVPVSGNHGVMRKLSLTAACVAVLVVCAFGLASVAGAATVSVGGPVAAVAPTSRATGFLGISTSLTQITDLSGSASDPDTAFDRVVDGLSVGAPPVLRLGGVWTDDSWWPIPGLKEKYLTPLTPRWAADVKAMLTRMRARAILGVNLESNSVPLASKEVSEFEQRIGAPLIDEFELGNEPEFFPVALPKGHPPHDYPFKIAHYGKQFAKIASGLGHVPLAGPASGAPHWLAHLGTLLREIHTPVKLVTIHAYPIKRCSASAHPHVSELFARSAIQGLASTIHGYVRTAAAHGKPLRVDEFNAVTCGGAKGVSNSFAEALWVLNALPALWSAGVQGVNLQTVNDGGPSGGANQVIAATRSGSAWHVAVQPEYYGLRAFADVAPAGSRLLSISKPGAAGGYQFATRAPDGSEHVVLTNTGATARTLSVRATGTHGAGSVSLLDAGSLTATGGTTLGGQRLSATTGQLSGTAHTTAVPRTAAGVYQVVVPAHAAAILTLAS